MQTEEFIARVENSSSELDSQGAREATMATLEALCEHLPAEQVRRLASQLPQPLSQVAEDGASRAGNSPPGISLNDFYRKVAERGGFSAEAAAVFAPVVARTLNEAVTDSEAADVALELPDELSVLISPGGGA